MTTKHIEANPFLNKQAFITGSSRGIGKAIALQLAQQGCHIILHYRRDEEAALETQKEILAKGVRCLVTKADLCDPAETQNLIEKLNQQIPTLDFFISNAASTAFKSLLDLNSTHVQKTFTLVIDSFLSLVRGLHPLLKNQQSQILAVSGIDTVQYCPGHGLLAAAKSALETICRYLSVELAADGIHVKCVNPGLVATDSTKFYLGDAFEGICTAANQTAPHGGFKTPDDLAKLILLLLRPESNWMASKTVYCDGDLSFMLPGLLK